MADTRTLSQLPRVSAVSARALTMVEEPDGGPTSAVELKRLLGRLISTEEATATEADLQALLAYPANSIALVFADTEQLKNGWYRKIGDSGSGNWQLFEHLSGTLVEQAYDVLDKTQEAAARVETIANTSYRAVATYADREAIPVEKRAAGMLVRVLEGSTTGGRVFIWNPALLLPGAWTGITTEQEFLSLIAGSTLQAQQLLTGALDDDRNLFDKRRRTPGFLQNDGSINANGAFYTSDFIPVEPGGQFTANAPIIASGNGWVVYFNAARARVTAVQNGNASFPAAAPINHPADSAIRFARVSVAVSDCNPSALTIARGATALPAYKEFGGTDRYTNAMTARAAIRAAAGPGRNIAADGVVRVDQLYNVNTKAYVAKGGYFSVRVPVPADMSVTIANAITYDPEFGAAWLDIDGAQMSKINAPIDAKKTLLVPTGAAYLELPGSKTAPVEVYVGAKVPAIPSSGPLASAGLAASMLFSALRRGTDLVDPARITRGYFRHTRSGEMVANPAAAVTHSMPCIPGQPVVVSVGQAFTITEAGLGWQYANGDIAGYVDPAIIAAKTYIAPPDVYFWFYNFPIDSVPACAIGDTVPYDPRKPFVGKNMAISGDSIVEQDTWGSRVAAILGLASYKNWGKSGTTMGQVLANRVADHFAGLSLYGIASGTNDFGQQIPVGSADDAKGAATFWGALRNNIETVCGWNPAMRVFMMTPLHRGDEFKPQNNAAIVYPLRAYRDAILECGLRYGIAVYDQYSRSNIGPATFDRYMKVDGFDKLHPNDLGGQLIAPPTAAFVEQLGLPPA